MSKLFNYSSKAVITALIFGCAPFNLSIAATTPGLTPITTAVVAPIDSSGEIAAIAKRLIDSELPAFDSKMLAVKTPADWTDGLFFDKITSVVGDNSFSVISKLFVSHRVADDKRVVRFDASRGQIRYENHARAWTMDQGPKHKRNADTVIPYVRDVMISLGLPREEFGDVKFNTQMMRLGEQIEDPKNFGDEYEMYRIVSLNRKINGYPVLNSRMLASVNNDGLIQRLKVTWPPFKMNQKLVLRSRDAVLDQAVNAVLQDDPTHITDSSDVKIFANLAYANKFENADDANDEKTEPGFRPVAIISIVASPTPYQVIIPLAEEASSAR